MIYPGKISNDGLQFSTYWIVSIAITNLYSWLWSVIIVHRDVHGEMDFTLPDGMGFAVTAEAGMRYKHLGTSWFKLLNDNQEMFRQRSKLQSIIFWCKTRNCFLEVPHFIRHDDKFVMRLWECWGKQRSGDWPQVHLILLLITIWSTECYDWSSNRYKGLDFCWSLIEIWRIY